MFKPISLMEDYEEGVVVFIPLSYSASYYKHLGIYPGEVIHCLTKGYYQIGKIKVMLKDDNQIIVDVRKEKTA